jgi:hypothetical protein
MYLSEARPSTSNCWALDVSGVVARYSTNLISLTPVENMRLMLVHVEYCLHH